MCRVVLTDETVQVTWDDEHMVPYGVKGDIWVGYDDTRSIEIKVSKLT